jgi:hypothetical protein
MAITDNRVATTVWTDVKSVLTSANLIASTGSSTSSPDILGAYNDKHTNHAQVIINPISLSEAEYKFGGLYGNRSINVIIEVYHGDAKCVDDLCDQIRVAMASPIAGMDLRSVNEDPDFFSPGDNKIKSKVIVFNYNRESNA